jgi:transposase, IS5 family
MCKEIRIFKEKNVAPMFNYTPQNQLDIFNFKTEFESKLDLNNRWVKLAKLLDWDSFANIYSATFSANMGAKSVDARVVIRALIIKNLERKGDREAIEIIKKNPYMQYFLGFDCFHFYAVLAFVE